MKGITPPLRGSRQDEDEVRSRAGGGSFLFRIVPPRISLRTNRSASATPPQGGSVVSLLLGRRRDVPAGTGLRACPDRIHLEEGQPRRVVPTKIPASPALARSCRAVKDSLCWRDARGRDQNSERWTADAMTPGEFIAKWRASELKERSAAQEHFIDLCRLPGEPTPAEADPTRRT